MRKITPFCFMLALLISCRSHKEVQRETIVDSDSVATTASHRTFASLDSVISRLYFDFDTLEITWQSRAIPRLREDSRGAPVIAPREISVGRQTLADTTEIVRLKAVKGRVASNRSQYRQAEEAKTRLDSTAYKQRSAESSAEHTATTAVYDPPNTTAIICTSVAIALLLLFIYLYIRRK